MNNIIASSKVTTRFWVEAGLVTLAIIALLVPSITHAALTRQLEFGMTGSDVSELQTFLARDTSIYPQGLVTGYFGSLTQAAVRNFQARNGISVVGRVGPITLSVINAQMGGTPPAANAIAPTIGNISVNSSRNGATVNWATNEFAKGLLYYSSSPLTTYESFNSVTVSGNTAMTDMNLRGSQSVALQNLQANTRYYYLIYVTDQDGNVSVTLPASFQTTN